MLAAKLVDGGHVDEVADLLLDGGKANVAVQLRLQVLHVLLGQGLHHLRFLSLGGRLTAGGLAIGRLGGHFAVGAAHRLPAGGRGGGGLGRQDTLEGSAPKIVAHAAEVALRHGADDLQLLEDDLVFFIHCRLLLCREFDMGHGPEQQRGDEAREGSRQQGDAQQEGKVAQYGGVAQRDEGSRHLA